MSHRPRIAVVLALAALLVAVPAAAEPAGPQFDIVPGTAIEADQVLLRADVRSDGSAAWTVEYRVLLDGPNASEGFAAVEERARENATAFAAPFARRMRSTAAAAAEATGREMVVGNVSVATRRVQLPRQYGVVTYRFEWYGFAAVDDGDRLRIGDAIAGLFLDRETTFVVGWPDGTRPVEVAPEPDERRERSVVWIGPANFGDGQPSVVVVAESETAQFGDPAGRLPARGGLPDTFVVGGLVGLVAVGGGLVRRWRRRSGPSEDLLSNEERVLAVVEDQGGRAKQQDVVEELDWTETKTSDVVSDLREAGDLEVYRLGRENVLALPGEADFGVGGRDDRDPQEGDG